MTRDVRAFLWLAAAWIPALAAPGFIAELAARRDLAAAPDPYWIPHEAGRLYLLEPLIALSGCVLLLSPGLVASRLLGRSRDAARLTARSLALSLIILAAVCPAADALSGSPVTGRPFGFLVAVVTVVLALVARARHATDDGPAPSGWASFAVPGIVFAGGLAAALVPKLLWEDLSGDGSHALETSRLLLRQSLPFWSPHAGPHGSFPGVNTFLFAYPASWFVRLFGDVDTAARLPLLLCLGPLAGAIIGVAEHGRDRLAIGGRALVWGALAAYAAINSFSATYSPYVADIAMPTASDTVCMTMVFGFLGSYFRGSVAGIATFGLLALFAGPAAAIVIVLAVAASLAFMRPRPVRAAVAAAAVLAVATFLLPLFVDALAAGGLPVPGGEHSAGRVAVRFRYLQFGHWRRLLWLVLPCGVMPVISMLRWRAQDGIARTVTVVTAVYFGLFFMIAYVSLHYFVPTMLLPLLVHWRVDVSLAWRAAWLAATAAGLGVAMWSALPEEPRCAADAREVAADVAIDIEGYGVSGDDVFRAADLLYRVYPPIGAFEVPDDAYGVSSLTLLRYAARGERPARPAVILAPEDAGGPPGAREAARGGGAVAWVLDEQAVAAAIARRPRTPAGSRIYAIETAMLFVRRNIRGARVLDLKRLFPRRLTDLLGW